jgi:GR25 family glycosyltransferase involved in LPS biosynthesis
MAKGLHTYVDKVYLINRDERTDRLVKATLQLKRANTEFERFPAVDGNLLEEPERYKYLDPKFWNRGALGLVCSTIGIIKDAKEKKYKSILIFEDDIELSSTACSTVENYINTIPDDWDMIFLGCIHRKKPEIILPRIARVTDSIYCHAYLINERIYDIYLESLERKNKPIDLVTTEDIQIRKKSYCIIPNIAFQSKSYSDISNRVTEHGWLK